MSYSRARFEASKGACALFIALAAGSCGGPGSVTERESTGLSVAAQSGSCPSGTDVIPTPTIPQNPFMAPNGISAIHLNAYQTDTSSLRGPGSDNRQFVQNGFIQPPTQIAGTLTFNASGQIIGIRVGLDPRNPSEGVAQVLLLVDQASLQVLDQVALPPRPSNAGTVSFSGGGYFYLDNLYRPVLVTATREIRIYSVQSDQFVLDQSYDLASAVPEDDILNSVLPDNVGNLWFISRQGVVGYVNRDSGEIQTSNIHDVSGADPTETNTKSFATDDQGGVYIVSDFALYRFEVSSTGEPSATWRTTYDRGTRIKPGQVQQGSGTTPTLFNDFAGNRFVTIADNADPFLHVNVYDRQTGALVAQQEVFKHLPGHNSTENSLIAVNHSVIVENNYGNVDIASTLGPLTTRPGVARIDFDPGTGGSEVAWENERISVPSVVSQLSTGDGLLYTYAKDARGWYFAALDFNDGSVAAESHVPGLFGGVLGNNFYSGLIVGPDHSAYVGVFGGIVAWRPTREHPGQPR